jgi:hypothetical protein
VKQNIGVPAAIAIVVVASAVIIGFLYTQFIHERKVSPEETHQMMMKHNGH